MILGAQGYNIRTFTQNEKDFRRSMKRVADIGYTAIQISGIGPIDPHVLREACDENGLKIVLTHTPEARILNETEAVIREHDILGCDYIGLGAMSERYRATPEWLQYFGEDFETPAKKIRDAGKLFMYHNHHFEFAKQPNGKLVMDEMLEMFPADLMGITVDTYWLQAAGCDIYAWLDKLQDRIPCVHFKDMCVVGNEARMAPAGEGNINFAAIYEQLKRQGTTKYVLIEQDNSYGASPFDCLETSYKNMAAIGLK